MHISSIEIQFPNGRIKRFNYSSFEFYSSTNELEHENENIIISLDNLMHSFSYEIDDCSGEIVNKEYLKVNFF